MKTNNTKTELRADVKLLMLMITEITLSLELNNNIQLINDLEACRTSLAIKVAQLNLLDNNLKNLKK